jgi:DNA polymerase-3 subunit epsilon
VLDYTALDFETANSYRGSPCAVGLVKVRDGVAVDERHWLIRPPEGADWFAWFNVNLHGITAEMVADIPRWKHLLPEILDFIGDDPVVAHNAGFDIGVIRYACAVDNIEWPEMRFLCTLVMARRALKLPSYRLPYIVESFGLVMGDHHDPLADAHGVVAVVKVLAEEAGVNDLADLAAAHQMSIGRMSSGIYKGSVAVSTGRGFTPIEVNPDADPDGYLYGRVVVFTGTLMSLTRDLARQECARVGASPEQNTTKRTNVLVIGDINPAVLRPGSNVTGKLRRAFELQDKGQAIEVMTEDDFLRCLDGKPLSDISELLDMSDAPTTSPPRDQRPEPEPPKPPRRRFKGAATPTDQACSAPGCPEVAAFKTRTKPTWCDHHITEILRQGGIEPLEPFTRPEDWRLTRCIECECVAHYRLEYTLDKNAVGEPTCRACFWRVWAEDVRQRQGEYALHMIVPLDVAQKHAEEHGYEYLAPLTSPSLPDDPHRVQCRHCHLIRVARLGDISSGCDCQSGKAAS